MAKFETGHNSIATAASMTAEAPLAWPAFETLTPVRPDMALMESNGIVGFGGRNLRSRPFALLRSQILRRLAKQRVKLIGLTSAGPAAGKTFISLNLAAALGRVSESPVYLIDLDLRRGNLAAQLGLECTAGMADVLSGREDLSSVGRRIEGANLAVYLTRPVDEDSAEMLSGETFARLAAGLRSLPAETIVICDLPPVFVGDDAMITLGMLDGFILVVDSGQTTARQVTQTLQLLEPTPCLGTILNRYRGGFTDNYGYGNYGYGETHASEN